MAIAANDRFGGYAHSPGRGDYAATPIAKPVAVSCQRRGWVRDYVVRRYEIADSAVMDVERQQARGRLGKPVDEFVPDPKFHFGPTDLVATSAQTNFTYMASVWSKNRDAFSRS